MQNIWWLDRFAFCIFIILISVIMRAITTAYLTTTEVLCTMEQRFVYTDRKRTRKWHHFTNWFIKPFPPLLSCLPCAVLFSENRPILACWHKFLFFSIFHETISQLSPQRILSTRTSLGLGSVSASMIWNWQISSTVAMASSTFSLTELFGCKLASTRTLPKIKLANRSRVSLPKFRGKKPNATTKVTTNDTN